MSLNVLLKGDEIVYTNSESISIFYNVMVGEILHKYKNDWENNLDKYSYVLNLDEKLFNAFKNGDIEINNKIRLELSDFSYQITRVPTENLINVYLLYKNTKPTYTNYLETFDDDLNRILLWLYLPYTIKELY